MADLSKIKLNGTTYNFKDAEARSALENLDNINITNTLASGTRIATINGTDIYAPEGGSGGVATETDPVFSASAAAEITTEKISAWDAKSDFSGSYNDLSDKPTIPTVPTNISAFTNDSGYLTSYTETDPTVPAWAKAESKPTYTAQEVGALPADTVIPTVPTNVSAFTNDAGYLTSYTETDPTVPSWAKASTKPTYTASEVGAATSSHVHGNVKNDGTITVNTSMANGDRLLFSDTSDSSKIKNTSITIGTSTTQYLANNGTWQNLPTVSVS